MSRIIGLTQDAYNAVDEYNDKTNDKLLQAMIESEELIKDKNIKQYNNFQEIRDELGV